MAKLVKKGRLIPLGNGFSLVQGQNPNKIDDVDIGPNNKNGLSVNDGEIIQNRNKDIRVFSAEPMFNGVSPASLLYGGANPDKVFAMQERWKQTNGIKDDGTKYQNGGDKYKTKLTDAEEKEFQKWYAQYANATGNSTNPDDKEHYYDYRGYWKDVESNPGKMLLKDYVGDFSKINKHQKIDLPDTYKTPGHPTFSDQSKYADDEHPGGHWDGDKYYSEEELLVPRINTIFSDYIRDYANIIYDWGNKSVSNDPLYDDSDLIKFANVNTDISKFLNNKSISKNSLKSVYEYSKKFGLDPYSIVSGLAIEVPNTLITHEFDGYNTHTYIERQIPANLKIPNENVTFEGENSANIFIKNIGLQGSGKEKNLKSIKAKAKEKLQEIQKIADADTITTSIGRYAKMIHDNGFDAMNPKQKGWTNPYTGGVVKHGYKEMIDSAAESLRKNYPNLFTEFEHKQFGGTMNKRKKAAFGDKINTFANKFNMKGADLIGLGTGLINNTIGLVSNLVSAKQQAKPVIRQTPTLHSYKLVDRVRPFVDSIREQAAKMSYLNDRTSASSRSRFARQQEINLNEGLQTTAEFNRANEASINLINQNLMNQQEVANQNIINGVNIRNQNAEAANQARVQRIIDTNNALAQFVSTGDSLINGERGILARQDARESERRTLAVMLAANPYAAEAYKQGNYKKMYELLGLPMPSSISK